MTIWLDIESGTWGKTPPVILDTEGWAETDWITFDVHMSDAQRSEYAQDYARDPRLLSPLEWYAETCVE